MSESIFARGEWAGKDLDDQRASVVQVMMQAQENGPGRYLRQMRELMGYDERETASRLSIGVHQVRALEADDFDNLPAPIFVRNYLRRYSEFVELPLEEVLQSYERVAIVDEPDLNRVSIKEKLNSRHISIRWALYSVVFLTLILSVIWWQGKSKQAVEQMDQPAAAVVDSETTVAEEGSISTEIALPLKPLENINGDASAEN